MGAGKSKEKGKKDSEEKRRSTELSTVYEDEVVSDHRPSRSLTTTSAGTNRLTSQYLTERDKRRGDSKVQIVVDRASNRASSTMLKEGGSGGIRGGEGGVNMTNMLKTGVAQRGKHLDEVSGVELA